MVPNVGNDYGSRRPASLLPEIGASTIEMGVTDTLYVCPNGSGTDGTTWDRAFTTIQDALAAASTDADDCTLIMISPHATNYDINTTGDPTYSGNYILRGNQRNWAKVMNTHGTATSILKFTGKVSLECLNFNLGTGSTDGVIFAKGGFRAKKCMFVGEDLTGAAVMLQTDGASVHKNGRIRDCNFLGHTTHETGGNDIDVWVSVEEI